MSDKFPKPEEIQKEFEEFVRKRFGDHVQVISHDISPAPRLRKTEAAEKKSAELKFDYKPKQIKAYLDRFVIGQDEAKKAIAIAFCDHYNQVRAVQPGDTREYNKQNVLILGPTGVGKTYMIRQIAKLIDVPFVKADATRFSETGYVGANVEDLVKDLVAQAGGDIERAQCGIIYLDEIDKLASAKSHGGRDVSGRGVQLGLLKLMEETEVDLRAGHDPASQMQAFFEMQQKGKVDRQVVNTKNILFVASGAFTGIDEIIARRMNQKSIGFGERQSGKKLMAYELMNSAQTQDFVEFGFEPEFIGRVPIRVACHELDAGALFTILKDSEGSLIHQYVQAFKAYGIDASFETDALQAIATIAADDKTGARALMTTLERVLRSFKYELPSTNVMEFKITAATVRDPERVLKDLLDCSQAIYSQEVAMIHEFEERFLADHGLRLNFDDTAMRYIIDWARALSRPVQDLCREQLQSYEHGLKLIQQNTGQDQFPITEAALRQPKQTLEKMVRDSYTLN